MYMKYIKGQDRNQSFLFTSTLDEYVEADNEVRVIDAFVDSLSLNEFGNC